MSDEQYYPHPRRIVTGHDDKGNSIVVNDGEIPCLPVCTSSYVLHLDNVAAGPDFAAHRICPRDMGALEELPQIPRLFVLTRTMLTIQDQGKMQLCRPL
jgi:hypothetical protein